MRKGPGTNNSKFDFAYKGDTYTLKAYAYDKKGNIWYKVDDDGEDGWIYYKYIKTGSSPTPPTPTTTTVRVAHCKEWVNVRTGPGKKYSTFSRKAQLGEEYPLISYDTGTNYAQITYQGQTGYIAKKYIIIVKH